MDHYHITVYKKKIWTLYYAANNEVIVQLTHWLDLKVYSFSLYT